MSLHGTFHVTQRAIPLLKASEAASIVTMSSLAGRFGYPNLATGRSMEDVTQQALANQSVKQFIARRLRFCGMSKR